MKTTKAPKKTKSSRETEEDPAEMRGSFFKLIMTAG